MTTWNKVRLLVALLLFAAATYTCTWWLSSKSGMPFEDMLLGGLGIGTVTAWAWLATTYRRRPPDPPEGYVPVKAVKRRWRRG